MEEASRPISPNCDDSNAILHVRYEPTSSAGSLAIAPFAKMYMAKNQKTGQNVAMKVVGKEKVIKVGMTEQVKRKISVMKLATQHNIIELHEAMATRSEIYFAMELIRGGELFSKIARTGFLSFGGH